MPWIAAESALVSAKVTKPKPLDLPLSPSTVTLHVAYHRKGITKFKKKHRFNIETGGTDTG